MELPGADHRLSMANGADQVQHLFILIVATPLALAFLVVSLPADVMLLTDSLHAAREPECFGADHGLSDTGGSKFFLMSIL